eukprot:sb/3477486/
MSSLGSFANFHFWLKIICKRLISLLVHLSRCPLSILSQFQSKMIGYRKKRAPRETSNFETSVCVARLRSERARPTSVCLPPKKRPFLGRSRHLCVGIAPGFIFGVVS